MARPTNRKEWLEKFLFLAGANRPAREFRTQLGIKLSLIPSEVAKLSQYTTELAKIKEAELKELAAKSKKKSKKPKLEVPKFPKGYSNYDPNSNGPIVPASG